MKEVKIKFETEEMAEGFMNWFCNSGEQDYFITMDDIMQPGANNFDYDFNKNEIVGTN